jgi:hypothetical protein
MGQYLQDQYRNTALTWNEHLNNGANKETLERLEWEHSRAITEFAWHRAVCSRCRRSSVVEEATLKLLAA